ncbi:L-lactate dehydrogenase (quinone) large subunit LdhH [Mesoterricola silvestris]|uniref:(Fe-S)-binding protein n=1 Tax=Mesoterricola silvestris TaxID=2927979 RepID=A0AA48GQ18_9BACT|nr:LUD domain-containing protein [Mesoterricola silvestris]BDU74009.1 (Fe-S)-binding protein [Mesoterricola silvestris]
MTATFKESIQEALANPNLRGALGRFSEAYKISREKAYAGMDFQAVRDAVRDVKAHGASHLEELAEAFKAKAEAAGAKVYRASDPAEVKAYILALAKENGVRSIVKSKSMATEEIHLNKHLEAAGIEVYETDLGEWIIQLCHQTPSHMVMPAIHMTKEEVAEVFSTKVEEGQQPDIPKLVKFARGKLRNRFLDADMGISGANIAVAETGSLVLVTNEGNARLVTTLPRIHVAVVGIEKLVASFQDVQPILQALPRNATSQLLTSYVSIITGQVPNTDGSPKQLHIILMDNKRTEMAADPKFRQALQCIRCASCLNVCPVFRLVGGHVFGKVYTGGIGTILTAWFDELKQSDDIQGLCIQCGACKDVCPGRIDIPDLILELRRRLAVEKGMPLVQKGIFAVVNNRRLFHSLLRAASVAQKPFAKGGFIRHLPLFLSGMTDFRSLPAIAPRPFRDTFKEIVQPECKEKAAIYAGCLIDFAYPEMGEAVVRVLNKAGIRVVFPEGQTCCGAPARYNGAYETAAGNARENIKALLEEDVQYVVSACPTCTVALRDDFISTFESLGMGDDLEGARVLSAKTIDFATLVKKLVDEGRLEFKDGQQAETITYHDSCHLKRTLNAQQAPRDLLKKAGFTVTEMKECDTCCGMAGSYSLKLPELSAPILERKLENIKDTGATSVAMDCPGCVMQIRGGLDKLGSGIKVEHTAVRLAKRLK